METTLTFDQVARLPSPGDNTAIAIRQIEVGTRIVFASGESVCSAHTILPGHRFAVRTIHPGEALTSWEMPFGVATSEIRRGDYVCNDITLQSLRRRSLPGVRLPDTANFEQPKLAVDLSAPRWFGVADQVPPVPAPGTFMGYDRGRRRGVGTRNFLIVLATSSRTAGLVQALASRCRHLADATAGIDGIVPVVHTEGGGKEMPNNRLEVLRTLSGFLVHPNVAAVVAIDEGAEPINNRRLEAFARESGRPLDDVPHAFVSAGTDPENALKDAEAAIRRWLPEAAAAQRSRQPLATLKLALQCGGSDAFSGVSGNPLAAQMARLLVRHGGTAIHAETDEIVGAESYMLRRVRDEAAARQLIAVIERFKERLAWHGATVEGNPSEGNRMRGLYNIFLKSLGAAAKKAPDVRIDGVLDYAEPPGEPGFFFMDSPGNDLESIAGEVGAGCNLIVFVTGNGSITNFPFVPTLKITTTTARHQLLANEMDINAGALLDGTPMHELTDQAFDLLVRTASSERTRGERAGHSQVSIWRNWTRTRTDAPVTQATRVVLNEPPLRARSTARGKPTAKFPGWRSDDHTVALERVGLILPVSLCSGQIARLAAERLRQSRMAERLGLSGFVALPHTEGCGFAGIDQLRHLLRMYANYARHPGVGAALFLEHGCEKTPNDLVRSHLEEIGMDTSRYGWASVQLDGGITAVLDRIEHWFAGIRERSPGMVASTIALEQLTLGLVSAGSTTDAMGSILGTMAMGFVAQGSSVYVPCGDPLWTNPGFTETVFGTSKVDIAPTLGLAERPNHPGLHAVQTETNHAAEQLAAFGASGAQLVLAPGAGSLFPRHPLFPVVPLLEDEASSEAIGAKIEATVNAWLSRREDAAMEAVFQVTRGFLGIST